MKQIRKRHSPAFKAKVALEAAKEIKTLSQLSTEYGVHQVQISKWKKELLETLTSLFTRDDKFDSNWPNYGKVGKMTYHCHLKKGRPTYVACWTVYKKNKLIEVYYAGTHEKAPY